MNNTINGVCSNTEVFGYSVLWFASGHTLAYFQHFFVGKFGRDTCLAVIACSMPHSISLIFASSTPNEIVDIVVRFISVKMSALHIIWATTNKSIQDYAMYCNCFVRTVCKHTCRPISRPIGSQFQFPCQSVSSAFSGRSKSPLGKYPSILTSQISRAIGNLLNASNCVKINQSHSFSPMQKVVVREPIGNPSQLGSCYFSVI